MYKKARTTCGLSYTHPKPPSITGTVIQYTYMNEEQVHSPNQGDEVPSQMTESPKKNGSVFAWVVILLVLLLIAGYFYYSFGMKDNNVSMPETIDEEAKEEPTLSNEEITVDTPKENWLVNGMNLEILNTRITNEYGRILAHPEWGAPLYVTSESCTADCLNSWLPYESTEQITDGNISTIYRNDTATYQYTWKGEPLYLFSLDNPVNMFQGNGVDEVWEFARP